MKNDTGETPHQYYSDLDNISRRNPGFRWQPVWVEGWLFSLWFVAMILSTVIYMFVKEPALKFSVYQPDHLPAL